MSDGPLKTLGRLLGPFYTWSVRYPPLLISYLVLAAAVWSNVWDPLRLGRLGVPGIFWHENVLGQLVAGMATSLFLGHLAFVGWLLDPAHIPTSATRSEDYPRGWRPILRTLLVVSPYPTLALFLAVPSVLDLGRGWSFAVGGVIGMGVIILYSAIAARGMRDVKIQQWWCLAWFVSFPHLRRICGPTVHKAVGDRRLVLGLPREVRQHIPRGFRRHIVAAAGLAIYAVGYIALWLTARVSDHAILPTLGSLVGLAFFASLYGLLMFHFTLKAARIVLFIIVGAILINSVRESHHTFRGLDYRDRVPLVAAIGDAAVGIPDREALEAWRGRAGDGKPVLAVVAASGGGLRAGTWALSVLTKLEETLPRFPYHVRIITGASGGMVGSAYYVSTLQGPGRLPGERPEHRSGGPLGGGLPLDRRSLVLDFSQDSLTAVLNSIVFPFRLDRGTALELEWERNTDGALGVPFRLLAPGEREGWRPSLVFTPMMVEDGRRLIISNLDLAHLETNTGADLSPVAPAGGGDGEAALYSRSAIQFFRLFPDADRFRLGSAARMSATFPYVTPAGSLPTDPYRRVVDAGYYDNFGVNLASRWIYRHRDWIEANTSGVVMIQIRDDLHGRRRREVDARPGLESVAQTVGSVTTPPEALMAAYRATMSFRNDEWLEVLDDELNSPEDPAFFTTVAFELSKNAPLSWYLPLAKREALLGEFEAGDGPGDRRNANPEALDALREWWAERRRP